MPKLLSGRFWLSIIAGIVFGVCAINKTLTSDVIATIITAVFLSYFSRDRNGNGNNTNNK